MASSTLEDGRSRSLTPDESGGEDGNPEMSELQAEEKKKKPGPGNGKDPNRPRRKKARRACFACQRAHLTCGDERPCQRCIKRGLQDACQDGVRKKAKYLHDAPNEALLPGVGQSLFSHVQAKRTSSATTITNNNGSPPQNHHSQSNSQPQQFLGPQPYPVFSPTGQMAPPLMQGRSVNDSSPFPQQSPIAPAFTTPNPLQSPNQQNTQNLTAQWAGTLFEDPSTFNFDISSMNFGNRYGALEFGMLGQMAGNAGGTPPSESGTQLSTVHNPYHVPMRSFSDSPQNAFATFNNDSNDNIMSSDWSNGSGIYSNQLQGPPAFAITSNAAFQSPDNQGTSPDTVKFEESPLIASSALKSPLSVLPGGPVQQPSGGLTAQRPRPQAMISTPQLKARSQLPAKAGKRARDPSSIYVSVTTPHPYTANFHALIAYLQARFASQPSKTLTIAKSLASIRPSFIATTKTLNRDDLIFMEKCFQRTLFEYEGFIEGVGTPTIVARRTGEIAAVGKEFQILTGWTKSVLLGRAPNLNVNRGHTGQTPKSGSGTNTAARNTGWNTPRLESIVADGEKREKPVFLAELLDDDSVVQFYEDFARLAFGDSRGSVFRKGKLLKYRTEDDDIAFNLDKEATACRGDNNGEGADDSAADAAAVAAAANDLYRKQLRPGTRADHLKREGISGEKGMRKLGSADGKVDCAYCWTVKRDVFDIPMLIVMNVRMTRPLLPRFVVMADISIFPVPTLHMMTR
ncbi:hypothetical protein DV736_g2907, partial [Chaetothyriales sp. CBS 134916]